MPNTTDETKETTDRRDLDILRRVQLLTRFGEYVVTAVIPGFDPPAEVVHWGARMFVRNAEGQYREALMVFPLRAEREPIVGQSAGLEQRMKSGA